MRKPEWYEEEIARLMTLRNLDRETAEKRIATEVAGYQDEFDYSEEIAWEYYDYARRYYIEKEAFASWMVEFNKNTFNPVTIETARLHFECTHLNYFEDFDKVMEERSKNRKLT